MKKNYKFLNNINFPSDIKKLSQNELKTLSQEVRDVLKSLREGSLEKIYKSSIDENNRD